MGHLTTFLLISGAVLAVSAFDQDETREKRSAGDSNPLSSFGEGWQNQLHSLPSNFNGDKFGIGNFLPESAAASGGSADKAKRSAGDSNPLSSFGEGWQNQLPSIPSNFNGDKFGIGNFLPESAAASSGGSADKAKRSAGDSNPLSSFGEGWQNQLPSIPSNFNGDKFGIGNFLPESAAASSGGSADKAKRSPGDSNPLSSFGEGWQNQLHSLPSNFNGDKFGIGNFLPESAAASGGSADKAKRSAGDSNPLSSFGEGWQNQLHSLPSNFNGDKFGIGNFLPESAAASGGSADKTKRSAGDSNPLSSFGEGWQNQLHSLPSNFNGDKFGIGNFLPESAAASSGGSADKAKRSAGDSNPLSSFGEGWQNQLPSIPSNFNSDKFGIGNFLPESAAASSGGSADKAKRSAGDSNPLSSFGEGWQNQLHSLPSNFNSDKFGIGNFLPESAAASGGSADKAKRSAGDSNPLSSFGEGWQNQLPSIPSNFNGDKFGIGNFLPESAAASGGSADKAKRSAGDSNPLSSFGEGWQNQLPSIPSNFNGDKFGIGNFLPESAAASSGGSADKAKRSAGDSNPLSSFGEGWQNQLPSIPSNFNGDKFGIGNFLPESAAASSGGSADKAKRSAGDSNPLSSFGEGWQNQLPSLPSNFNGDKFGIGNFLPESAAASGGSADKAKRSAGDSNPLSSFGEGWQNQLHSLPSNFNGDKFGIGNFLPESAAASSGGSADKAKRSAGDSNPLSSFGEGWQNQLPSIPSNFNGDKFGIGNFLPESAAASSGGSADKAKRSAGDSNPLSSFGEGWQNQLPSIPSNFNSDKFGIGNFLPESAAASGGSADKAKRSAGDSNPLSSFGEGWQNQLHSLPSNFNGDKFGIGNFLPESAAASSGGSADKAKRSAGDSNPLSSFGEGWQNQLPSIPSNFNSDKFGIGNFLPESAAASGGSADKAKRSAGDSNPLSSFGEGWQNQLHSLPSNFNGDKFGIGNFLPESAAASSGGSADKAKRSAGDSNPLSSFGEGWQNQLPSIPSNFNGDKFGIGNFLPESAAASSGGSADKAKRSAGDSNPLSSFGEGWQNQLPSIPSNFNSDKFGIGNFLPESAAASGGSAEKSKRDSIESSSSWTEKLKSIFTGSGAE